MLGKGSEDMIEEEVRVVPGQLSLFHPVRDLLDFKSAILNANKVYKYAEILIPIINDIFTHTEVLELIKINLEYVEYKIYNIDDYKWDYVESYTPVDRFRSIPGYIILPVHSNMIIHKSRDCSKVVMCNIKEYMEN